MSDVLLYFLLSLRNSILLYVFIFLRGLREVKAKKKKEKKVYKSFTSPSQNLCHFTFVSKAQSLFTVFENSLLHHGRIIDLVTGELTSNICKCLPVCM